MGKQKSLGSSLSARLIENDFNAWVHSMKEEGVARHMIKPVNIEGQIPEEVSGIFYRNGPGLFSRGQDTIKLLDGDGYIVAVEFADNGEVYVTGQFVKTNEFCMEQKAQRLLFRGTMGTKTSDFFTNYGVPKFKNVSNTNLLYANNRLFSLWEGGHPYELDPKTLETIGKCNLGILKGADAFSAHPSIDTDSGNIVNFGVNIPENYSRPFRPHQLILWEFTENMELISKQRVALKLPFSLIHDMCITCQAGGKVNYAVFAQSPIKLSFLKLMAGNGVAASCSEMDEGMYIYVTKRQSTKTNQGPTKTAVFRTGQLFSYHCMNAFVDGQTLVFDIAGQKKYMPLEYQSEERSLAYEPLACVGTNWIPNKVYRFVLDLENVVWDGTTVHEIPLGECIFGNTNEWEAHEMACLNPKHTGKPYRYLFAVNQHTHTAAGINRGWSGLVKMDFDTMKHTYWYPENSRLLFGDPVFVPSKKANAAEDDGNLLSMVFDPVQNKSSIVVLDTNGPEMSLACIVHLNHSFPVAFHTLWLPSKL